MPKTNGTVDEYAGLVRTAMRNEVAHSDDSGPVHGPSCAEVVSSCDATHAGQVLRAPEAVDPRETG